PFLVKSIQVDGGSEFMGEFEDICEKLGLPLYVLPPRRPDYNGGVKRGNRTFREEFYAGDLLANNITQMRKELLRNTEKYNNYRPHSSLNGATQMEYIRRSATLAGQSQSHELIHTGNFNWSQG
ncbi:MAG: integrase core domain-containing protein, partial [Holosporales bacterium]|nr:integrase core domain-containing protein [Holosporales bacterium]